MTALTSALPRNWSRTSTQAIAVPVTALITATAADSSSVSFSAATASWLEAVGQKPLPPALAMTAASGSRTMRLR